MPLLHPALLMFTPERWGEAERFSQLHSKTYNLSPTGKRALSGVINHFEKALTFEALAQKISPRLEVDRQQLEEHGYSPSLNSRELSAVIEASVLELYSSIDCTAKIIIELCANGRVRGLRKSTRYLFEQTDRISGDFPDALKINLKSAGWFKELRFLRDELTHLQTGSCHLNDETSKIFYMHVGIRREDKPLIIDNILHWLRETRDSVNATIGSVFRFFNEQLSPTPLHIMCGMTMGRALLRQVDPSQPLTFHSGTCQSFVWFEKSENPTCPFADNCGAYHGSALNTKK